eukprot:CAMPEP_0117429356 /NCGR_PEP_ID=MMETSP0758-20121206/8920_1 /TAXON_ID=63605 /ORGANISM="Percolomonas cosmopolitus, Strain AE-1 (ATCC 50343)" /LENGTH=363 /DNA_ID=CAMNT_0005216343 /DNA_START=592 /DNA_END=1680 /DNA_ORIENTATION=-
MENERELALSQAFKHDSFQRSTVVKVEMDHYPFATSKSHFYRALVIMEQFEKSNVHELRALLLKHGSKLLDHIPRAATNLMIRSQLLHAPRSLRESNRDLRFPMTKEKPSKKAIMNHFGIHLVSHHQANKKRLSSSTASLSKGEAYRAYIRLFGKHTFWLMVYLECIVYHSKDRLPSVIYNTLIECYLEVARHLPEHLEFRMYASPQSTNQPYLTPSEMTTHSRESFLDSLQETSSIELIEKQRDIMDHIKLFDDYEFDSCRGVYDIYTVDPRLAHWSLNERIQALLHLEYECSDPMHPFAEVYDCEQVLLLCQSYEYEYGILLMYKKLRLTYKLIDFFQSKQDYATVVEKCKEHGKGDPNLW